jgi:hypothetical protein
MPLYLDWHDVPEGVTAEDMALAHLRDLQLQTATAPATCLTGLTLTGVGLLLPGRAAESIASAAPPAAHLRSDGRPE